MATIKEVPKTKTVNIFNKKDPAVDRNLITYLQRMFDKHGDTYQINFGFVQITASANPDFIKEVLQTQHKHFGKSKGYEALKMGLGNGLVTSEGDYWRKQRRLSQPAFYKSNLENLYKEMMRTTAEYVEALDKKRGQTIDIAKEMMTVTATIVLRALFSVEQSDALDKIYVGMERMQDYVMAHVRTPIRAKWFYINGRHRQFKKEIAVFDDLIYGIINERRNSGESKPDLLQMLMDVEDADTGERMTDLQLRDELITLFSAGHETSANALAWTWYLLAQNPEIVQKLRAEVNTVLADGRMPTFEDLRKLSYTKQVIDEGMRLYPPAWVVGRRAEKEIIINDYKIPKGRNVLLEIYLMHRSPDLWENPLTFDPDRFSPEAVKNRNSNQYLPFGAGPRMCIGNHFAVMEMQLLMAAMVQRFDFEIVENHPVELDPLVTLRPKHGIKMVVK